MATSDSEDFESADEGRASPGKKERKERLSSSNYSDNALETNENTWTAQNITKTPGKPSENVLQTQTDGWDDFDIDDNEPAQSATETKTQTPEVQSLKSEVKPQKTEVKPLKTETQKKPQQSEDSEWDDFDDWGQDDTPKMKTEASRPAQSHPAPDIKEVTDRLAAASTGGWGWGWSVDSLLSTASAGITNITSQVSQGISTVLETGIGAPDPEELARRTTNEAKVDPQPEQAKERSNESGDAFMPFGNLLSGVTKFVETTSTKVISGGLDTLETIGKKTMEVLQDGDPGLAKKRAMLGLGTGDKPVLSQVLREAKTKAEEEDKIREEKREAKEVHYENLFDDFEGLVHLEALEMLSKQVSMRIEERLRSAEPDKRQDIKETLQQVAELCEMPEEDDDDDEPPNEELSKADAFHELLKTAIQDLGLKLQFQPLVKQYTDILDYVTSESELTAKAVYKRAVSGLAQATALSVEVYHKSAEMLLVKTRRSTADEADALTQMTVVLTKHVSELATVFTEKLNATPADDKEQINNYITNIFLEAGNSSTYIQNAFQLALPILQIGAV